MRNQFIVMHWVYWITSKDSEGEIILKRKGQTTFCERNTRQAAWSLCMHVSSFKCCNAEFKLFYFECILYLNYYVLIMICVLHQHVGRYVVLPDVESILHETLNRTKLHAAAFLSRMAPSLCLCHPGKLIFPKRGFNYEELTSRVKKTGPSSIGVAETMFSPGNFCIVTYR